MMMMMMMMIMMMMMMIIIIIIIIIIIDWDNYLLTNDRPTRGKYKARVGQRLTPIAMG